MPDQLSNVDNRQNSEELSQGDGQYAQQAPLGQGDQVQSQNQSNDGDAVAQPSSAAPSSVSSLSNGQGENQNQTTEVPPLEPITPGQTQTADDPNSTFSPGATEAGKTETKTVPSEDQTSVSLNENSEISDLSLTDSGKPSKSSNKVILVVLGVVLLLLLLGGIAYYFFVYRKPTANNPVSTPVVNEKAQETEATQPSQPANQQQPVQSEGQLDAQNGSATNGSDLQDDSFIKSVESKKPTDLSDIEENLNSLDFEGIDTDFQSTQF